MNEVTDAYEEKTQDDEATTLEDNTIADELVEELDMTEEPKKAEVRKDTTLSIRKIIIVLLAEMMALSSCTTQIQARVQNQLEEGKFSQLRLKIQELVKIRQEHRQSRNAYLQKQAKESQEKVLQEQREAKTSFEALMKKVNALVKQGRGEDAFFALEESTGLDSTKARETVELMWKNIDQEFIEKQKDRFDELAAILISMYDLGVKVTKRDNNCLSDSLDMMRNSTHKDEHGKAYWLVCYDFTVLVYMFLDRIRKDPQLKDSHLFEKTSVLVIPGHAAIQLDFQGDFDFIDLNITGNNKRKIEISSYDEENYRKTHSLPPTENITLLKGWPEVLSLGLGGKALYHSDKAEFYKTMICLQKALEIAPGCSQFEANLVVVLDTLGHEDEALALTNDLLVRNPDHANVINSRGHIYYKRGEYEKALQYFRASQKIKPENVSYTRNVGIVLSALKKYDEANDYFKKVIELDPKDKTALFEQGNICVEQNQLAQAIVNYNKAIESDPTYMDAYLNRGKSYRFLGQFDKALSDFEKVIEKQPDNAVALIQIGHVDFFQKKYRRAIEKYNEVIAEDPNIAFAYTIRAYSYMMLRNYAEAISDYSMSLEIQPNQKDVLKNRGHCYNQLGLEEEYLADNEKKVDN